MRNRRTLYIVGAGASSEVNLPTGNQLKKEIADSLDIRFSDGYSQSSGDRNIANALKLFVQQTEVLRGDVNLHLHACWRIRDAMPQAISIDNFIDTHNNDEKIELCGKLAIVQSILKAERNSLLYIDDYNLRNKYNFSAVENTWYSSFMMLLTENRTKENLATRLKSIALIVFNYDRCIEHFLYISLQNYYGVSPDEASSLVNEIEIHHPYGVVGRLPWQGSQSVEFGANSYPQQILDLASQIKTFTEGTDPDGSEIIAIHDNILQADNIVFLGFAFHKLNMKLIFPDPVISVQLGSCAYFGTAKGISKSDCALIKDELNQYKGINPRGVNIDNSLSCTDLFREYWRSFSLN